MSQPHLFLAGADIGAQSIWTWQWDESPPRHHVVSLSAVTSALAEVYAALPDPTNVAASMAGKLTNQSDELALSAMLARVFIPDGLAREIYERCDPSTPGVMRVLPPPSSFGVPWELLPISAPGTGHRHRLIELLDVEQVAPPLTRDGAEARIGLPTPKVDPLLLIDPKHPEPVLSEIDGFGGRREHAQLYNWPAKNFWKFTTAATVGHELADRRSRMLWVGHVAADTTGISALQLSDNEILSATTLFEGRTFDPQPDLAVWTAPPRVGLLACKSGSDLGRVEPFGLVVAFLERGAELVIATRWILPTDRAFAETLGITGNDLPTFFKNGPFNAAAHAVDDVLDAEDPIRALGDWQRERLKEWRTHGRLVDSPIIWASLANYHAPYRTVQPGDIPPHSDGGSDENTATRAG